MDFCAYSVYSVLKVDCRFKFAKEVHKTASMVAKTDVGKAVKKVRSFVWHLRWW